MIGVTAGRDKYFLCHQARMIATGLAIISRLDRTHAMLIAPNFSDRSSTYRGEGER